jgi:tetratricopeptide (TPR) repeat protein
LQLSLEQNPDKNSIEQAEVEQVLASISVRSGHCAAALERYRRILEIRTGKFPPDSNQMANAYSSVAFTLTAMYQIPEAFEYFAKVFACLQGKDVETQRKNYNIDRFLRNRARANYYRGEFARAIEDLDEADRHQSAMYGTRKHYHGE